LAQTQPTGFPKGCSDSGTATKFLRPTSSDLDVLDSLGDPPWSHRPTLFDAYPDAARDSYTSLPSPLPTPIESDPTKADPHDLDEEKKFSPDIPGAEQNGQRG